jgi:hypothetical protein
VQGSIKLGKPDGRTSLRYMALTRFGVAAQGRATSHTRLYGEPPEAAPVDGATYDWEVLGCGWQLGMCPLASAVILSRSDARSSR